MNRPLAVIFGIAGIALLALAVFSSWAYQDIVRTRDEKIAQAYMLSAEDVGRMLEGKSLPLVATVDGAFSNTENGQDLYLNVTSAYAYKQKLDLNGILEVRPDLPFCRFDALNEMEDYKITIAWECPGLQTIYYTEAITNMRLTEDFPGIDVFIHIIGVRPK